MPPFTASDLIPVAVKDYGPDAAIHDMSPFVGENTLILSLMNGISSEERLADGLKNTLIGGSHSDV